MPKEPKIIPVLPGFRWECQVCGTCCRVVDGMFVTHEDIVRLTEYGVPFEYKKGTRHGEQTEFDATLVIPTIAMLFEANGSKRCFLSGDGKNPNACALHWIHPFNCYRFPFLIVNYRGDPPTLETLRNDMQNPDLTEEEAAKLIHTLEHQGPGKMVALHHMFCAQTVCDNNEPCPGFGKGEAWDADRIEVYIRQHHQLFENHAMAVHNTIKQYTQFFGNADFDKHLEPVPGHDGFYRARRRSMKEITEGCHATPGPNPS